MYESTNILALWESVFIYTLAGSLYVVWGVFIFWKSVGNSQKKTESLDSVRSIVPTVSVHYLITPIVIIMSVKVSLLDDSMDLKGFGPLYCQR